MKEKVLYRQPADHDLQAAFTISKNSFSDYWSKEALQGAFESENYSCVIAQYEGKLIGYALAQTILNEAEIVSVVMEERYRRCGIAFCILEKLQELLKEKGITYLVLEVRVSNESAIHLYEKFGFRNIGIRKDFYTHPLEDAYVMTKELEC